MFKIAVTFKGFETKEQWKEFAHKLYGEKNLVKYITFENYSPKNDFKDFDDVIDHIYDKDDKYKNITIGHLLSIETRSRRILSLLNELLKKNHYDCNYITWQGECKIKMSLDELLEKY